MKSLAWVVALGFLALSLNGWAQQGPPPGGPPPGGHPPRERARERVQDPEKKDCLLQEPQEGATEGDAKRPPMPPPRPPMPLMAALDPNGDHVIDAQEIAGASAALLKLDKNADGKLTPEEFLPPPPPMRRGPEGAGGKQGRPGRGGAPPPPPPAEEGQK